MTLLKISGAYLFLLFLQNVSCDDLTDLHVPFGRKFSRQSYASNHPPLNENEGKIPVAIVYEDVTSSHNFLKENTNINTQSTRSKGKFQGNFGEQRLSIDENSGTKEMEDPLSKINSNSSSDKLEARTKLSQTGEVPRKRNNRNREERKKITNNLATNTDENKDVNVKENTSILGTIKKGSENITTKSGTMVTEAEQSEMIIPVQVVYDKPPVTRSKVQNQRRRVDSDRVRGFRLQKIVDEPTKTKTTNLESTESYDKTSITTYHPPTAKSITATTTSFPSNTMKAKIETNSVQPVINSNASDTQDSKDILNSVKSKELENGSSTVKTPRIGKRTRERDPVVPIVESTNNVYGHSGSFKYSYEGGDGTKAYSQGELKTFDEDKTGESVAGGFSYKDKDGKDFSLTYTADENGYRPIGEHLPTPPPIPVAIARALKYLATKTTPAPVTEAVTSKLSTSELITTAQDNKPVTKKTIIK